MDILWNSTPKHLKLKTVFFFLCTLLNESSLKWNVFLWHLHCFVNLCPLSFTCTLLFSHRTCLSEEVQPVPCPTSRFLILLSWTTVGPASLLLPDTCVWLQPSGRYQSLCGSAVVLSSVKVWRLVGNNDIVVLFINWSSLLIEFKSSSYLC